MRKLTWTSLDVFYLFLYVVNDRKKHPNVQVICVKLSNRRHSAL